MTKVVNNSNILIFITSSFPYGNGETFIESEINQLFNLFDKVIIVSHDTLSKEKRNIPKNISIVRERYSLTLFEKIIALKCVFSRKFLNELAIIKSTYNKKVRLGILKTMILSLYNAERLQSVYDKFINQYNVENVFCYSYWCNDSALSLSLLNKKDRNIKTFCRIHGWDVYFEASKYNYLPFRQFIAANCDTIFAISKAGKTYAIDKWGAKSDQIQVSRLGISNNYKIDLKKNEKPIHIVSCSNIIPLKRLHLIAGALKQIKNVKLKWTHFGDGSERDVLESLIKTIPKSIEIILKGRVTNNEIYSFYNLEFPHLFINVSASEGIPVSIMEAMSFGIPVIATNVGGVSEIVNNENGYLLDSHTSAEKVAEKITEFYNLSIEKKNIKRKAAFDTWNDKYNATKNYTQFVVDILSL